MLENLYAVNHEFVCKNVKMCVCKIKRLVAMGFFPVVRRSIDYLINTVPVNYSEKSDLTQAGFRNGP